MHQFTQTSMVFVPHTAAGPTMYRYRERAMEAIWQDVQKYLMVLEQAAIDQRATAAQGYPHGITMLSTVSSFAADQSNALRPIFHTPNPPGWLTPLSFNSSSHRYGPSPIPAGEHLVLSSSSLTQAVPPAPLALRADIPLDSFPDTSKNDGGQDRGHKKMGSSGRKPKKAEKSKQSPPDRKLLSRKNHGLKATTVLQDWVFRNLKHPYPSKEQKRELALASQLQEYQVLNWLNNARKRLCHNVSAGRALMLRDSLQ